MTVYATARDLARYRHNSRVIMRRYRTLLPSRFVPEWVRRGLAKDLTGPTESELRAIYGDR